MKTKVKNRISKRKRDGRIREVEIAWLMKRLNEISNTNI